MEKHLQAPDQQVQLVFPGQNHPGHKGPGVNGVGRFASNA